MYAMGEGAETTDGPGGRKFYGSVTVGERGQIALPVQARRDHNIGPGDKLVVLGSPDGIALMSAPKLLAALDASHGLLGALRKDAQGAAEDT